MDPNLVTITIVVNRLALVIGIPTIATILIPIVAHFWPGAKSASEAQTHSVNDEYFALYPGKGGATEWIEESVWKEEHVA